MTSEHLTPNQLVAYNLTKVQQLRGFTQEEAAGLLAPFLGTRWSKATFSAAERSVDGQRVRQFTADDMIAFAQAFGVPVMWFLLPPDPEDELPRAPTPKDGTPYLSLLYRKSDEVKERLVSLFSILTPVDLEDDSQHDRDLAWIAEQRQMRHLIDAALQAELGPLQEWLSTLAELLARLKKVESSATRETPSTTPEKTLWHT